MDAALLVTVCVSWYLVPSMFSGRLFFIQVTVVAGEPVEVQVKDLVVMSNVRLMIRGGA